MCNSVGQFLIEFIISLFFICLTSVSNKYESWPGVEKVLCFLVEFNVKWNIGRPFCIF